MKNKKNIIIVSIVIVVLAITGYSFIKADDAIIIEAKQ